MRDIRPLRLHVPQPARHIEIVRRNDRVLCHVLEEVRRRIRVRHATVLIVGRAPLGRGGKQAVAVGGAVQRVAHFVHHHGEAAPVVMRLVVLVEEHDVVVRVVGEVGVVIGEQQHAFDVCARADRDAAEELDEVPDGIRTVFVAAEDLMLR